jgi:hypothetical protein
MADDVFFRHLRGNIGSDDFIREKPRFRTLLEKHDFDVRSVQRQFFNQIRRGQYPFGGNPGTRASTSCRVDVGKTGQKMTPIRAQAAMANHVSGHAGMKTMSRSPLP